MTYDPVTIHPTLDLQVLSSVSDDSDERCHSTRSLSRLATQATLSAL